MDWIKGNFSDNISAILETYQDITEKDKRSIKSQFAGFENNSDKYKWLELLQKDNNNSASTKKYYCDIFNNISKYKEYFENNCTKIENLVIGKKYSKKQIALLAGSGDIMSGIITSHYGNKKDTFITIKLDENYDYKSCESIEEQTRNIYNNQTKELKYYVYTKENAKDYQILDFTKNKNILYNSLGNENNSGYIYAFVDSSGDNLNYISSINAEISKYKGYIYIGKYIFKDISNKPPYYFTLSNADKVISYQNINQYKINSLLKAVDIYQNALKKESNLSDEEKKALVKIRTNQGEFREKLLYKYNFKCPLTGFENEKILIASHIKPWSECSSKKEKLNENNGILLNALADKLFDKGLITFDNQGKIIYSKCLSESDTIIFKKQLKNQDNFLTEYINSEMIKYLDFHRNNVFLN